MGRGHQRSSSNNGCDAHHSDVIMSMMASEITGVSVVCSTVCSGADQRKHQSSASLAFVRGVHRWPVESPQKGPVKRKMFPFDDVIMAIPTIQCTHLSVVNSETVIDEPYAWHEWDCPDEKAVFLEQKFVSALPLIATPVAWSWS